MFTYELKERLGGMIVIDYYNNEYNMHYYVDFFGV